MIIYEEKKIKEDYTGRVTDLLEVEAHAYDSHYVIQLRTLTNGSGDPVETTAFTVHETTQSEVIRLAINWFDERLELHPNLGKKSGGKNAI